MIPERDPVLRYKVEDESDRLLNRAKAAAEGVKATELRFDQVQGLLRQAQAGYGVEHLCNWLRYQQARVSEWRESGLADAILADVAAFKEDARTIASALYPERPQENFGVVWLALVRRYAAYLERWYRVISEGRGDG